MHCERGALPPDPRPAGGPGRGLALRAGLLQSAVPVKVASAHLRGHSSQGNQMMNRREKRTHKLPRTFGAPAIRCANTDTGKDSPAGRRRTSLAARCAARTTTHNCLRPPRPPTTGGAKRNTISDPIAGERQCDWLRALRARSTHTRPHLPTHQPPQHRLTVRLNATCELPASS